MSTSKAKLWKACTFLCDFVIIKDLLRILAIFPFIFCLVIHTFSACKWEWKQLLLLFLNIFITIPHLNFVQTEFYKARIVNYFHSASLRINTAKDVVILINFFDFSFPKLMKAISFMFTICHIGKSVLHIWLLDSSKNSVIKNKSKTCRNLGTSEKGVGILVNILLSP